MKCAECGKEIKTTEAYPDYLKASRLMCCDCSNQQLFSRTTIKYFFYKGAVSITLDFTGTIEHLYNEEYDESETIFRVFIVDVFLRRLYTYKYQVMPNRELTVNSNIDDFNKVDIHIDTYGKEDEDKVLQLIEIITTKFFVKEI